MYSGTFSRLAAALGGGLATIFAIGVAESQLEERGWWGRSGIVDDVRKEGDKAFILDMVRNVANETGSSAEQGWKGAANDQQGQQAVTPTTNEESDWYRRNNLHVKRVVMEKRKKFEGMMEKSPPFKPFHGAKRIKEPSAIDRRRNMMEDRNEEDASKVEEGMKVTNVTDVNSKKDGPKLKIDFRDAFEGMEGQFRAQNGKIYIRGSKTLMGILDHPETDAEEKAFFQILKEAAESDEMEVAIGIRFEKVSSPKVDRLMSDEDDEDGEAQNVEGLHYCRTCAQQEVVTDAKNCISCEIKEYESKND